MTALANQVGAINLAQGFPDFPCDPLLVESVVDALRSGMNQYAPMPGLPALREAVAGKYRRWHGIDVDADREVTITPGATAALYTAISTVVHPGDEVIIFEPAYDSYAPAIVANGGVVRPCPLRIPDFRPDFDRLRSTITERTRLIILNTPHNPSGTIWSEEDIRTFADIVAATSILVLSDEVYDHMVYDGRRHWSPAHLPSLRDRTFVVTSFGKTMHTTGWKVGCCMAAPRLTEEFRKVHQFLSFSVHTPTQAGLATYIAADATRLNVGPMFEAKRNRFRAALDGSPWTILPCEGSYFQLLGYDGFATGIDTDVAVRSTHTLGVASIPLSPFTSTGAATPPVLRFCFAKADETLDAAARRLRAVEAMSVV